MVRRVIAAIVDPSGIYSSSSTATATTLSQALFEGTTAERTPASSSSDPRAAVGPGLGSGKGLTSPIQGGGKGGVHNNGGVSGLARFQTMSSAIQAVLEVAPLSVVGVTSDVVGVFPGSEVQIGRNGEMIGVAIGHLSVETRRLIHRNNKQRCKLPGSGIVNAMSGSHQSPTLQQHHQSPPHHFHEMNGTSPTKGDGFHGRSPHDAMREKGGGYGVGMGSGMASGVDTGGGIGIGSGLGRPRSDMYGNAVLSVYSKEREERMAKPRFNMDTMGNR